MDIDTTKLFRNEDNYINGTLLCKIGGNKKFGDWIRLNRTKEIINILSNIINIDINNLIKYNLGRNSERATWIHPQLGNDLANWISPQFSVFIYNCIEEWKSLKIDNLIKYNKELEEIKSSTNNHIEKDIQTILKAELSAETEIKTPVGNIDLLTYDKIIEIKHSSEWKHAIGQILAYSNYYPHHSKIIYLFDFNDDFDIELVKNICNKYKIEIRLYTQ
jgi:hypothetical protein